MSGRAIMGSCALLASKASAGAEPVCSISGAHPALPPACFIPSTSLSIQNRLCLVALHWSLVVPTPGMLGDGSGREGGHKVRRELLKRWGEVGTRQRNAAGRRLFSKLIYMISVIKTR